LRSERPLSQSVLIILRGFLLVTLMSTHSREKKKTLIDIATGGLQKGGGKMEDRSSAQFGERPFEKGCESPSRRENNESICRRLS